PSCRLGRRTRIVPPRRTGPASPKGRRKGRGRRTCCPSSPPAEGRCPLIDIDPAPDEPREVLPAHEDGRSAVACGTGRKDYVPGSTASPVAGAIDGNPAAREPLRDIWTQGRDAER